MFYNIDYPSLTLYIQVYKELYVIWTILNKMKYSNHLLVKICKDLFFIECKIRFKLYQKKKKNQQSSFSYFCQVK